MIRSSVFALVFRGATNASVIPVARFAQLLVRDPHYGGNGTRSRAQVPSLGQPGPVLGPGRSIPFAAAHPATLATAYLEGGAYPSHWSANSSAIASAATDGHACVSFPRRCSMQLPRGSYLRGPFGGLRSVSPRTRGMGAAIVVLGGLEPFAVRFASTAAASAPPYEPTGIFVKVGDGGDYAPLDQDWALLKGMVKNTLLKAIKADDTFGPDLMGVKFSGCVVGVVVSGPTEPDVLTEATKVVKVSNLMTVLDATTAGNCTGERLFIHVRLPGAEPVGLQVLRHPSADAATARAAMHPQWQDIATRLERERKAMMKPAALHRDKAIVSAAEAPSLDMTVLGEDTTTGIVHLGVFKMPSIPEDTMKPPKGLPLADDQPWFYLEQRATLCHEFLQAMKGKRVPARTSFGVLLSGPNGTGKSAIGVETALTCFARGMVSIYISTASEWVEAARNGNGDGFLLERLLRQNADLIAAQPALRKALAPALVVEPDAVGAFDARASNGIIKVLCSALTANRSVKVGLIVDEVQNITAAISSGKLELASTAPRVGADYFQQWHNWDNRNRVFVRMDIASSHGARELNLPPGEEHRLRIIKPWSPELVAALTMGAGSPCEFPKAHESARKRIIFSTGGIPRTLLRGKQLLDEALATYDMLPASKKKDAGFRLPSATLSVEGVLRVAMEENCSRWFLTLTADEKIAASSSMLQLVRGEVRWTRFKGLYDDGLIALLDHTLYVTPVSAVATSVIITVLAGHYLEAVRKPLLSIASGVERGIALELQVIARLAKIGAGRLPAMTLKGDESAPMVLACADERLLFAGVDDLEQSEALARLYIPASKSYTCDAITIPPSTSAAESEPIVVWEMSVTSPRDPKRVDKVLKWFGAEGIVTALRAAHPGRPIVCALCWPEKLDAATPQAMRYAELTTAADVASKKSKTVVSVAVVDMEGLQALGVLL